MRVKREGSILVGMVVGLVILRYFFSVAVIHYIPQLNWAHETAQDTYTTPRARIGESPDLNLAHLWLQWDSGKYISIVQHGYEALPYEDTTLHNWAFYPLYPSIVRVIPSVFGYLTNTDAVFATGIILSGIFLALGLYILKKLLALFGMKTATWYATTMLLIAFPTSYFFHMFYPESLFLLLSLSFFYLLFTKKYLLSSLCLSLALITRPNALVLLPSFFLYLGLNEHKKTSKLILSAFAYSIIIFTPLLLFFFHLYLSTGDFFASFKVQKAWNNEGFTPFGYFITYLKVYGLTLRPEHILSVILLISLLVGFSFMWITYWRQRSHLFKTYMYEVAALFIYSFGSIFILTSMKNMSSTFRHVNANFALFALPVLLGNFDIKKHTFWIVIILFILLQLIFFTLFLTLIPVYGF